MAIGRRFSSDLEHFRLQQIFNSNRQLADTNAGRVVDRRSDGRSNACHADFADAARAILIHDQVGIIEESHVEVGKIGAGGNEIVREIAIDGLPKVLVVMRLDRKSVV